MCKKQRKGFKESVQGVFCAYRVFQLGLRRRGTEGKAGQRHLADLSRANEHSVEGRIHLRRGKERPRAGEDKHRGSKRRE